MRLTVVLTGHYAYVEFRNVDEANNARKLGQVSLSGRVLRVTRPLPAAQAQVRQSAGEAHQRISAGILFPDVDIELTLKQLNQQFRVEPPGPVLCFRGLLTFEELVIEEEFQEVRDAVQLEASKYGYVVSLKIPRPRGSQDTTPGLTNAYVEFENANFARVARKEMRQQLFRSRPVDVVYHSLELYRKNDFSVS